jgi:beta-glucosidase/6-phospho-beta-glucosidase/beta-galactosidase
MHTTNVHQIKSAGNRRPHRGPAPQRGLKLALFNDMTTFSLARAIKTISRVELLDTLLRQLAVVPFWIVLAAAPQAAAAAQGNFPAGFAFGVANAPAQVEDGLDDIWSDWAREGHTHAWFNAAQPNERLQFWNHPEVEINLAQNLGVNAFRMGLDWGRIMPAKNTFDIGAIRRYRDTIRLARSKHMKVMLTLWHHDVPKWVQKNGGWHNPETANDFKLFAERMIAEYHDDVEWFVTFNEANVFVLNAYITGAWPPGETASAISILPYLGGSPVQALDMMAFAHNAIYDWAHQKFPTIKIGLAHNMAHYLGRSMLDRFAASQADAAMNWHLPSQVAGHLDFFGMNYYGAEWLKGSSVEVDGPEEYSDAGRAIDVNGLSDLLTQVHAQYPSLPIILTENGIADAGDHLRPAYMVEHLLAVHHAIASGIPVVGYFVWTLTDNLEWTDGYCPRFGLAAIDRTTMQRRPRASFRLYSQIIQGNGITQAQRDAAWAEVRSYQGQPRPMCRAADGSTALDTPRMTRYSLKDWRFH